MSKDTDKRAEIEEMMAKSEYYDPSSIRTRNRRQFIRADYEQSCAVLYDMSSHEEFWGNKDIIERQKRYLAYYVEVSQGQLGDTIKGMLVKSSCSRSSINK